MWLSQTGCLFIVSSPSLFAALPRGFVVLLYKVISMMKIMQFVLAGLRARLLVRMLRSLLPVDRRGGGGERARVRVRVLGSRKGPAHPRGLLPLPSTPGQSPVPPRQVKQQMPASGPLHWPGPLPGQFCCPRISLQLASCFLPALGLTSF